MTYPERRTIVSLITGVLIIAAYCIYVSGRYQAGVAAPDDLKFWAGAMLTFVGIGVAASIVIQIIFHILMSIGIAVTSKIQNQELNDRDIEKSISAEMVEDEMDKLIGLKSMRISYIMIGIGFIAALISLVLGFPAAVMLNILFFSFFAGSLLEGFAQLYFYRRGVTNG